MVRPVIYSSLIVFSIFCISFYSEPREEDFVVPYKVIEIQDLKGAERILKKIAGSHWQLKFVVPREDAGYWIYLQRLVNFEPNWRVIELDDVTSANKTLGEVRKELVAVVPGRQGKHWAFFQ